MGNLLRIPDVRRTLFALFGVEVGLVLLHLVFAVKAPGFSFHLASLSDLRAVGSWPTWFSAIQFAAIGVIAFALAGDSGSGLSRAGWRFAGLFFLFLSMDQACGFHDHVGRVFSERFGPGRSHLLPGRLGPAVELLYEKGIHPSVIVLGLPMLLAGLLLLVGLSRGLQPVPGAFSTAFLGFALLAGSQAFGFLLGVAQAREARASIQVLLVVGAFLKMFGATAILVSFLGLRKLDTATGAVAGSVSVFDSAGSAAPLSPSALAGYRAGVRRYGG